MNNQIRPITQQQIQTIVECNRVSLPGQVEQKAPIKNNRIRLNELLQKKNLKIQVEYMPGKLGWKATTQINNHTYVSKAAQNQADSYEDLAGQILQHFQQLTWRKIATKQDVYFIDGDALKLMPDFIKGPNIYRISHEELNPEDPWYLAITSITTTNPKYPIGEIFSFIVGRVTAQMDPETHQIILIGGDYIENLASTLKKLNFQVTCQVV